MIQSLGITFVICLVVLFLYFKWSFRYWAHKNVPYLPPTIPWGNLDTKIGLTRTVEKIYRDFKKNGVKHGGIFSVTNPVYVPVDLEYIKNVMMKDFDHFMSRGIYHNEKAEPIGTNLLTVDGQKWRASRVQLTPTFTSAKMKVMFETVLDCGEQLKEAFDEMYVKSKVFDIKEQTSCFTADVIGSCAFGLDCNSFKNPDSEFRKYGSKVLATTVQLTVRFLLSLSFPGICRRFGMRMFPADATSFFRTAIKDVIDHRERSGSVRKDFVQQLLQMKNNKDDPSTLDEVSAHAFFFFIAGFETSSDTMTFCLYELACNPDVQDKVRTEINEVLAKHGDRPSYECMNEMQYMTQVIEGEKCLQVANRIYCN